MAVLKVKRVDRRAVVPSYAHDGDMCFDLRVLVDGDRNRPSFLSKGGKSMFASADSIFGFDGGGRDLGRGVVHIEPHETVVFKTGLVLETEEGFGVKVHVRSSVGIKKHLMLSNQTGIIDTATYRGELLIALTNFGDETVDVEDGERVAQCEIVPVLEAEIVEVSEVSETDRGEGGIGSTGIK